MFEIREGPYAHPVLCISLVYEGNIFDLDLFDCQTLFSGTQLGCKIRAGYIRIFKIQRHHFDTSRFRNCNITINTCHKILETNLSNVKKYIFVFHVVFL
jgi:hypothetical protein